MKYNREQILQLREEGKSYKEIAGILGCTKSIISYYCSNGKEKRYTKTKEYREKLKKIESSHTCCVCGKLTKNLMCCSKECQRKSFIKTRNCLLCNNSIPTALSTKKYCAKCQDKYRNCEFIFNLSRFKLITIGELRNKYQVYQMHAKIRCWARRLYGNYNKSLSCKICNYNLYCEVCHIKPVSQFKDSDNIYDVNHIDNLVVLCPNHHWEFDNGYISL